MESCCILCSFYCCNTFSCNRHVEFDSTLLSPPPLSLSRRLIRLTSPNLNNIIVLGAIVLYLAGLAFFYPQGASRTGIIWGCNVSLLPYPSIPSLTPLPSCQSPPSLPSFISPFVSLPSPQLRAWTAALGFSACYGTLNVKMWRVYSICRNPRPSMSKSVSHAPKTYNFL